MPFIEAVRLALQQIWAQKLKSFFTMLGVMIGVTFLIAVVSIVGGMTRYMSDQLVGKLIAINSFEIRKQPKVNINTSDDKQRELARRPWVKWEDIPFVTSALDSGARWAAYGASQLPVESKYVRKPKAATIYCVAGEYFSIKRMEPA